MGIFDGCLLASDLDGTLIHGDIIPKRNIEMIKFFTEEGGIFSVATGRSPAAVDSVLNSFENIGPSVFTNGSVIYDYSKKELLNQSYMTMDCNIAIDEILKFDVNVGIQVHSDGKVYVPKMTDNIKLHIDFELIKHIDISLVKAKELQLNKVLYFLDEQDRVEEILKKLLALNLNCEFFISSATILGKFYKFIEQCPKGVTKANGLKYLLDKYNIKKGNFFAIGDYYNDITMIKSADIGATVADAPDDIKLVSDFVSGSAKDGAVADFIEYLSNIKRGF